MKIIILLSLILLASCSGGGGGSKSTTKAPANPIPETPQVLPDIRPTCSDPVASTTNQGLPFHAKGRRNGDDYFLICNAEQLAAINSNDTFLSKTYYLGDDIELGFYYTNVTIETFATPAGKPGNQFVIAPNPSKPFTGLFYGDNFAISNFRYVNDSTSNLAYCGFFGYTDRATISGLQLENVRIDANVGACGALVGHAKRSYFKDISIVTYPIEGFDANELLFLRGAQVAGMIAKLENSIINESYSVADLETLPSLSNLLAGGLFLSISNGSEISDVFYDGNMILSPGTAAGAISTYKPFEDPQFEAAQTLFSNVWYSNTKGVANACSDDSSCSSDQIFSVDTLDENLGVSEGGPYFFMYANNEPLASWSLSSWWFIGEIDPATARYPWLD
jgi:hypothetical protein